MSASKCRMMNMQMCSEFVYFFDIFMCSMYKEMHIVHGKYKLDVKTEVLCLEIVCSYSSSTFCTYTYYVNHPKLNMLFKYFAI